MDRTTIRWTVTTISAGAVLLALGCNSSSSPPVDDQPPPPPPPPVTGIAYNGPGSKWDFELNDNDTFEITRRPDVNGAIDLQIEGTYVRSPAGFVILTVGSATGTDAPSQGDTAWAVEAEGYALMLYTQGDDFIPMVKAGTCPTEDFTGNWVTARKRSDADATDDTGDYFGSFAFEANTGAGSLPARHAISDGFPSVGPGTIDSSSSCANGIVEVTDAVMYLTDNGGAIVHTNISNDAEASFIFTLAQKAVSSVGALDAEYAGILFDGSAADGARIQPASLACSSGICSGAFVTDVSTNATGETFTIDLFGSMNVPLIGFLTGTVTSQAGDSGNLACMVDEDVQSTGQRMFSCVGQAPGDNTRMFNLFFASNEAG